MQAEELKYLSHEAVIKKVAPMATLDNVVSGIPAAITLAQFIIESFWGRSPLASASNNCFGMKKNLSGNNWPGSTWTGKSMTWVSSEASSGETVRQPSEFRVYASVEDSIADHSAYLAGAMNGTDLRYNGLRWQLDYRTAAQIIKDGGYATAPDYVEVLCAMIERYNLTQYNVAQPPFLVRVTVPMVAARKGPGSEYPATVVVRGPNVFTITEVQGSYGRLTTFAFRLHGQGQAQGLPVGQIVQTLQELGFHKFRRAFHLHPPGSRVIHHRQAANYFSHVILRPSLSANWTLMISPVSG